MKHKYLEKILTSLNLMLFMNTILILSYIVYNKINYIALVFYFIGLIRNIYFNLKDIKDNEEE